MGLCQGGKTLRVARAAPHYWEEPCISGSRGSGTVFFSGCSLRCLYCQNEAVSHGCFGKDISTGRLREIFEELQSFGVHNINLVNPTHYVPQILEALTPRPCVPVLYNTSGYETLETLRLLDGAISIYLPDLKYSDNRLGLLYSGAKDYFETATAAILEMYRQVGDYQINSDGILERGVVIRHLVLPGHVENSYRVLDWVREHFQKGSVLFSLMGQYVPCGRAKDTPPFDRRVSPEEFDTVQQYLFDLDIEDGYIQELDSADTDYIPDFSLQGV